MLSRLVGRARGSAATAAAAWAARPATGGAGPRGGGGHRGWAAGGAALGLAGGLAAAGAAASCMSRDHVDLGPRRPTQHSRSCTCAPPHEKHPCTKNKDFFPGCHELLLFSGDTTTPLAEEVGTHLGTGLGRVTLKRFADGEVAVQVQENVRGRDVYIMQSCTNPVGDGLMELLLLVSTVRRSSAKRVTVVLPYMPYRFHRRGSAIQTEQNSRFLHSHAADVATMLEAMGIDRVIAVDLQRPGQGHEAVLFSSHIPVETLSTTMLGVEHFADNVHFKNPVVVVAPNTECVKKARKFQLGLRQQLDMPVGLAAVVKGGRSGDEGEGDESEDLVGAVAGADVIVVDELIDTGTTLCNLARMLKERGAKSVHAFSSHALLSGDAAAAIDAAPIDSVVVSNTVKLPTDGPLDKITQLSVAHMVAASIKAAHWKGK